MDLQQQTSIKGLFQGMIPDHEGVVRGRVVAVSPLEIQVLNDDKLRLPKALLCVPRHLSKYQTTCDILSGNESGATDQPPIRRAVMTVDNALKSGDMVFLLSFNEGKKYYVLDREET